MKVKKIIHYAENAQEYGEAVYESDKVIDMPYVVGKIQVLVKGFEQVENVMYDQPLFNESGLARIELSLGKNGLHLLAVRSGKMLGEVFTEPETLSTDLYITDRDTFMYSFYNNTDAPNITITAKLIDMDQTLFNKVKANLTDYSFRQYILKKMLAKSRDKDFSPPTPTNGKKNLTVEEVAEYLNLAVTTIYNKVYKKEIPFHKTGKKLLFKVAEIEDWLVRESRQSKK